MGKVGNDGTIDLKLSPGIVDLDLLKCVHVLTNVQSTHGIVGVINSNSRCV